MNVLIYDDVDGAARAVADRVVAAIHRRPNLVLGLAAGHTPLPVYAELKRRHSAGMVNFADVTTFNLDEFVGVDGDHPGSFRSFMQRHLFGSVNIAPERIGFLNGLAADADAECRRFEAAIQSVGGIDLQLLGIGINGHIGFNEPSDHLVASTHQTRLLPATREANAPLFGGDASKVPLSALTMGVATILSARDVILMAFGEQKAGCIEQTVRGAVTTRVPASFLQLHPRVELFLDRGAASQLT